METHAAPVLDQGYDVVGRYQQDQVNGFSDAFVDRMLDLADLAGARTVLDAMGGDGNLTARLREYCLRRGIPLPKVTVLEFSRVQCEFARHRLAGAGAEVVCGDVLGMSARDTGAALPAESFDRVLIKSANHEIPLADQAKIYAGVHRVLAPGGLFVNLGFLFDQVDERDEFREIARVKDRTAGMTDAAERRHFLTREEFYSRLSAAGFADVRCGEHFEYRIHSQIVEQQYFARAAGGSLRADLQIPQVRALALRRHGRVRFEQDACIMNLPGEITVARKPTPDERRSRLWRAAEFDRLRALDPHRRLLEAVAAHVPQGGSVLELGCALGLLCETLAPREVRYRGIDPSAELVAACRTRHPEASFAAADLDGIELPAAKYDTVVVLNSHNLPGIEPVPLLRSAFEALQVGGRLIVFTPNSAAAAAEAGTRFLAADAPDREPLRRALHRYLALERSGWSFEGTLALLREIAPCEVRAVDRQAYEGLGTLVVVEKRRTTMPDAAPRPVAVEELFQRSLTAHLPPADFARLQGASVLVAGLGGGSNIAELLARKGVGRLLIADLDRYEPHNIRQRGSLISTQGREKVAVMRERLLDINPHLEVVPVPEGITLENIPALVRQADTVIDMIDFHGLWEKVALYREARTQGKFVITAPSVVDGAVLYVFAPDGVPFERFFDYQDDLPLPELGMRFLRRLIPHFPPEAPAAVYQAAARGERTIPLDAVGVDQAAVLAVAAWENLALGRRERVVLVPRGIRIDASDPAHLAEIVDFAADFTGGAPC